MVCMAYFFNRNIIGLLNMINNTQLCPLNVGVHSAYQWIFTKMFNVEVPYFGQVYLYHRFSENIERVVIHVYITAVFSFSFSMLPAARIRYMGNKSEQKRLIGPVTLNF